MKIEKLNIIKICNWKHPDFGVFASFLCGLSKEEYINIPEPLKTTLCQECKQMKLDDSYGFGTCMYCCAMKKYDCLQCNHTWTVEDKIHCVKCGIFKDFLENEEQLNNHQLK